MTEPEPEKASGVWWANETAMPSLSDSQIKKTHWTKRVLSVGVVVSVLGVVGWAAAAGETPARVETTVGYNHTANLPALIGGCTDRIEVTRTNVPDGVVPQTLPNGEVFRPEGPGTVVPVRGFMYAPPVDVTHQNFFNPGPDAPDPLQLLNNMWSGAMVIYYNPAARKTEATDLARDVENLQQIAATARIEHPEWKLIVAPWPTSHSVALRGMFPGDRPLAFAAWGNVQYCYRLVATETPQFREDVPVSSAPGATGAKPPVLTPEQYLDTAPSSASTQ